MVPFGRSAQRRHTRTIVAIIILALGLLPSVQPVQAQAATGSVAGRVYQCATQRPQCQPGAGLPGTVVTLDYKGLKRAALTDANGDYRFDDVPPMARIWVIVFRAGWTYLLRNDQDVLAGRTTRVDFGLTPEADPPLVPTLSDPRISVNSAEPGQEVTFSMTFRRGSDVPLSDEILVASPQLGRMILLDPIGNDRYSATWRVPNDLPDGIYDWHFVGTDEACREPSSFPVLQLAITRSQFFSATNQTVPGAFMHYWNTRGGLDLYGYPISEARQEVSASDGQTYLVQYFERNRFEYHPEKAGTPFEVELGLLGRQVTVGREGEAPFQRVAAVPDTAERRYFDATGHTLGGPFKRYWEASGGLAQFGFPISEEFVERNRDDGQDYTVQYFERARFEYHPEKSDPRYQVLLGLLGVQVYTGRR